MSDDLPRGDETPRTMTDPDGRTWELVGRLATCDVSDATLGLVVAMVLLVPAIALSVAHVIWGLPEWLAPVTGALAMFGLVSLMASIMDDRR